MEKKGLQNEKFIRKIKKDGSTVLKPKNDVGINVVDKSDTSSGLISGKLIRPKYNQEELLKSVDTEISELLPRTRPELADTVLRSIYNDALTSIDDLTAQVETLEGQVGSLTSRVESLNATTESLKREIDGLIISKVSSDEQLVVTQESFSTAQTDLQIAIQNSTQEAIQRVSLTARNQSLLQEVDLLREQLFGRTAQIAAGADSLSETVTINNLNKGGGNFDIYAESLKGTNGFRGFKSGEKFEIVNSGADAVTVKFEKSDDGDTGWFSISIPGSTNTPRGKQVSIPGGQQVVVTIKENMNIIDDKRPTGWGKTRNYDGKVVVTTPSGEVQYTTRLRKARKASKL
jgi:cell division protein FtsB